MVWLNAAERLSNNEVGTTFPVLLHPNSTLLCNFEVIKLTWGCFCYSHEDCNTASTARVLGKAVHSHRVFLWNGNIIALLLIKICTFKHLKTMPWQVVLVLKAWLYTKNLQTCLFSSKTVGMIGVQNWTPRFKTFAQFYRLPMNDCKAKMLSMGFWKVVKSYSL